MRVQLENNLRQNIDEGDALKKSLTCLPGHNHWALYIGKDWIIHYHEDGVTCDKLHLGYEKIDDLKTDFSSTWIVGEAEILLKEIEKKQYKGWWTKDNYSWIS